MCHCQSPLLPCTIHIANDFPLHQSLSILPKKIEYTNHVVGSTSIQELSSFLPTLLLFGAVLTIASRLLHNQHTTTPLHSTTTTTAHCAAHSTPHCTTHCSLHCAPCTMHHAQCNAHFTMPCRIALQVIAFHCVTVQDMFFSKWLWCFQMCSAYEQNRVGNNFVFIYFACGQISKFNTCVDIFHLFDIMIACFICARGTRSAKCKHTARVNERTAQSTSSSRVYRMAVLVVPFSLSAAGVFLYDDLSCLCEFQDVENIKINGQGLRSNIISGWLSILWGLSVLVRLAEFLVIVRLTNPHDELKRSMERSCWTSIFSLFTVRRY